MIRPLMFARADAVQTTRRKCAPTWRPIAEAPEDPDLWVWVKTSTYEDLPEIVCPCKWHPDYGWCVDEIRVVTHFAHMAVPI